jgi:hypothetical protein
VLAHFLTERTSNTFPKTVQQNHGESHSEIARQHKDNIDSKDVRQKAFLLVRPTRRDRASYDRLRLMRLQVKREAPAELLDLLPLSSKN